MSVYSAYSNGYVAYYAGIPRDHNPYPYSTAGWASWDNGNIAGWCHDPGKHSQLQNNTPDEP